MAMVANNYPVILYGNRSTTLGPLGGTIRTIWALRRAGYIEGEPWEYNGSSPHSRTYRITELGRRTLEPPR